MVASDHRDPLLEDLPPDVIPNVEIISEIPKSRRMANTENVDPATKKIIRQVYIGSYLIHVMCVADFIGA